MKSNLSGRSSAMKLNDSTVDSGRSFILGRDWHRAKGFKFILGESVHRVHSFRWGSSGASLLGTSWIPRTPQRVDVPGHVLAQREYSPTAATDTLGITIRCTCSKDLTTLILSTASAPLSHSPLRTKSQPKLVVLFSAHGKFLSDPSPVTIESQEYVVLHAIPIND